MHIIQKGNRQLSVDESQLVQYLQEGYCEIDKTGKVVQEGVVKDPAMLKVKVAELEAELAKEKEQVAKLKKEVSELKKAAKEDK